MIALIAELPQNTSVYIGKKLNLRRSSHETTHTRQPDPLTGNGIHI